MPLQSEIGSSMLTQQDCRRPAVVTYNEPPSRWINLSLPLLLLLLPSKCYKPVWRWAAQGWLSVLSPDSRTWSVSPSLLSPSAPRSSRQNLSVNALLSTTRFLITGFTSLQTLLELLEANSWGCTISLFHCSRLLTFLLRPGDFGSDRTPYDGSPISTVYLPLPIPISTEFFKNPCCTLLTIICNWNFHNSSFCIHQSTLGQLYQKALFKHEFYNG